MDYTAFCKNFFEATNIPVNLLENGRVIYSALGELLSIPPASYWEPSSFDRNPAFCSYSPDIEYGRIHIDDTGYDVFIGPCFNVPLTEHIIHQFMRELMISHNYREPLAECLAAIPRTSHLQFARYLLFLYQCLNGKEAPFSALFSENTELRSLTEPPLPDTALTHASENLHNSYAFESGLYKHIKAGNVRQLQEYLAANPLLFREGKMAHSPARHTKNLFISIVSKVGILGAIPGGMDIEKTYQLIDLYIQKCEQLQTIEEVFQLQYTMLTDFCHRVNAAKRPDGISTDVANCMDFIRSHLSENLSVDIVAAHVHRSSSYMMKRFREELGIHIGAYITRCKLEEAKSLLTYSDKPLAEISSYLCFSSQSYFQNVFKKQYHITPLQYRKKTQRT